MVSKTSSGSGLHQPVDTASTSSNLGLIKQARLVWRLLRDSRVSDWLKLIPVAALVYLLSPIDLIPDLMLPGLGELDDLAVILLSLKMLVELSPPSVVREHIGVLLGKRHRTNTEDDGSDLPYIDAPYRVIDRDRE
jgi:uncharacterized membrane protein YkvA (DUF1232 family)